ncbi:MAG TPA: ABC transporter permease subunit [Pirellulales bacterium]|nr:ABC transporter permease subunit [Pirellulales bacterium]
MMLLRAWITLFWLSFRRLFWSTSTLMVLVPMGGGLLFLARRRYDRIGSLDESFQAFSNYLIMVFVAFMVPVCALAYGTSSVGADREDRTLLFLLIRPIPRWLILSAKFAAALPLSIGLVALSFNLYCRFAGPAGELAYQLFLPAILYSTLAYLGLFHMFAVLLRHSTIAALVYALFMEMLLGNMPGIVKRLAVNYYGRSLMYAAGATDGVQRPGWFEPISGGAAGWTLAGIAAGSLLLAIIIFQVREYRDLS